ncbi:MAG: protein-L-isoaspartate(D-aspartate) O-methyltransferase [Euryarchaeota archaeon]|nr:protein-L-isoaspartate(D-aspartate) O-methyltransferase [Euryarchaeota archaeon]
MAGYEEERRRMVERLIASGYLRSQRVIDAMLTVPRHLFVPEELASQAYSDEPLPIARGQTVSAPHMVAIMCEALEVESSHRVLEVGAGSGYHACVVSLLAAEVYSIEREAELAELARRNISRAGCCGRVEVVTGDGTLGYPEKAPYHRIYVTAGAPEIPQPLVEQLAPGGKLLIPVGSRLGQELLLVEKLESGELRTQKIIDCVFVPLIGRHGWKS